MGGRMDPLADEGGELMRIAAIVKRSKEKYGHMQTIDNFLPDLQMLVDGHVKTVMLSGGVTVLCNQDVQQIKHPHNCTVFPGSPAAIPFYGDIVVVGMDGDEYTDIPIHMQTWKRIYLQMEDGK